MAAQGNAAVVTPKLGESELQQVGWDFGSA